MISGRYAIISLIIFFALMTVAISILSIVAELRERRHIKRIVKLSKDQGFVGDCDIASLTAFRIHVREQIKTCEELAEYYRDLLKEVEGAIESLKGGGG